MNSDPPMLSTLDSMSDSNSPIFQLFVIDLYLSVDHQSCSTISNNHNHAIFDHSCSFTFEFDQTTTVSDFHRDCLISVWPLPRFRLLLGSYGLHFHLHQTNTLRLLASMSLSQRLPNHCDLFQLLHCIQGGHSKHQQYLSYDCVKDLKSSFTDWILNQKDPIVSWHDFHPFFANRCHYRLYLTTISIHSDFVYALTHAGLQSPFTRLSIYPIHLIWPYLLAISFIHRPPSFVQHVLFVFHQRFFRTSNLVQ